MDATTVGNQTEEPEASLENGSPEEEPKGSMLSGPCGVCMCIFGFTLIIVCVIFATMLPQSTDDKETYEARQPGTCTLPAFTEASRPLLNYRCKKSRRSECLKRTVQNKITKCVEYEHFDSWSLTFLDVTHTPEDGGSTSKCELKHRALTASGDQSGECIPSAWCFKNGTRCDEQGKQMPGSQDCFVTDGEKGYCSLGTRDYSGAEVWLWYLISVISVVILSIAASCFCGACLFNTFNQCTTKTAPDVAGVEEGGGEQEEN